MSRSSPHGTRDVAGITLLTTGMLCPELMSEIIVPGDWRDRIERLAGRRWHVWPVAAVIACAVLTGLFFWSRGAPNEIAPPAREPRPSVPAEGAEAGPSAGSSMGAASGELPSSQDVILVHVAGAVRRPGLYELRNGARVAEAIDAARGPRPKADLNAVNLAEPLVDGTKLDVPRAGEAPLPVAGTTAETGSYAASEGPAPAVIPLNSADQAALETIPGVGPVTATAILEYRAQIGAFSSIDQLMEVSGIGPATLESIRPYVSI